MMKILLIATVILGGSPALSQRYQDFFPPSEEEYDPLVFDPNSLFGAPLGGYARATRSRLAALPLRLVGGSVFWATDNSDRGNDEGDVDLMKDESDTPYFTMRDGTGRKFACRIYNEDELTSESISQSIFTQAIEVDNNDGKDDVESDMNSSSSDDDAEVSSKSSQFTQTDALNSDGKSAVSIGEANEDESDLKIEIVFTEELDFDDDEYLSNIERMMKQTDLLKVDDITLKNIEREVDAKLISEALDKLKDKCAQLHSGWWSYEWCHESQMKQFHIQMQSNTMDDVVSVHDLIPEFVVQSISTVGTFHSRKIVVEVSNPNLYYADSKNTNTDDNSDENTDDSDENTDDENTSKDMEVNLELESVMVVETYKDGEYCEEIKADRRVDVHLMCCSDDEVQNYLQMENGGSSPVKNLNSLLLETAEEPRAILLGVEEASTCKYTAKICTNVLCDNWLHGDSESFNPLTGDNAPDNALKKHGVEFHKDDSIRYILDTTLEDTCLRRNEGWWTFSYCHKSTAYQYHENVDIEFSKGTMKTTIESKNILGKYALQNDNFPDEDEVKYIVSPNKDDEAQSSSMQVQNVGVNSPYFTQEYHHGDICEGEDVIDSAIKGGNVIEGGVGVERSSIIRFFCGNKRELVRVDEDHTCHYIIDITVPELCFSKYFEIPHIKKHAVKCLPVD